MISASALARTLDALSEGLLFCDRRGAVVHANAALAALIGAEPERRRVFAVVRHVAAQLAFPATGQRVVPVPLLRTVRTSAATYRVRGTYLADDAVESEAAIVVVLERAVAALPTAEEMHQRFGLTRREAAVALLLAEGRQNELVAAALHISPHTARHHTESVLTKLGVRSRAEVGPALLRLALERS